MGYEDLLTEAYDNIKPMEHCERFEVKKVEGHIEGSKTIISNFMQVVSCIGRDAEHVAKFLFKELATSGEIARDRLILTRRISSKNINEKVEKYFKKYVECSNCKKPDTEIIGENGQKFIRCMACGAKKPIV